MTRLAVVIPAYNAARTLPDTLRSLQAQTMEDWEAVVVDDSDDTTYNIARAFGERDPRIWAIRQERRPKRGVGHASAVNLGLDRTSSAYVANLDADDQWLPDFAETCIAALERARVGGVYTDRIEWHEESGIKYVRRALEFEYFCLLYENYVCFSGFVARRELFRLDPRWEPVADWHAVIEVARNGLARVPLPLVVRRIHAAQWSAERRLEMALKSFLLSFHYSPMSGLCRLAEYLLAV